MTHNPMPPAGPVRFTLYRPEYARYRPEYARFAEGMAFAGESEVPSFEEAVAAVKRLCGLLPR
ncbi:hypothetical protein ACG3SL_08180 [Sphingomonas sp. CJ20]